MSNHKTEVNVDIHILSRLVAAPFEVAEMNRTLQVRGGIEKQKAVPGRQQLQALDYAIGEVNASLAAGGTNLEHALCNYDAALEVVMKQTRTSTLKRTERPINLSFPKAIPKRAKGLFYSIGKQGVSNTLSLVGDLGCAPGTISKNVEPLLLLNVVERQKWDPVVGKRNWAYVYRMTERGQKTYYELFSEHQNLYFDYEANSERFKHHLAVNVATYLLHQYEAFGYYFGHEGKYTERISSYGIKSKIMPDSAGYLDDRLTFIELETGNDNYSFKLTLKKYLTSKINTLLVVITSRALLPNYVKMIKDTGVEGEYVTEEPLSVFVVVLQDLVNGFPPELVAIRNRDGSQDRSLGTSRTTIYSPW